MSVEVEQDNTVHSELSEDQILSLELIADELRLSAFEIIDTVSNGHIGASSSASELLTVLYFGNHLTIDI